MRFPFGVDVTVHDAGGYDRRGNPLPETSWTVGPCEVRPGNTDDVINRATGVTADYIIYAPAGTQIPSTARVTLPDPWGGTWSVTGISKHWDNPFTGDYMGVEIALTGRQG